MQNRRSPGDRGPTRPGSCIPSIPIDKQSLVALFVLHSRRPEEHGGKLCRDVLECEEPAGDHNGLDHPAMKAAVSITRRAAYITLPGKPFYARSQ